MNYHKSWKIPSRLHLQRSLRNSRWSDLYHYVISTQKSVYSFFWSKSNKITWMAHIWLSIAKKPKEDHHLPFHSIAHCIVADRCGLPMALLHISHHYYSSSWSPISLNSFDRGFPILIHYTHRGMDGRTLFQSLSSKACPSILLYTHGKAPTTDLT